MNKYPNFDFIDVAFGGTHNRNHLIKKGELPDYARRWKEQNKKSFVDCYITYWFYPNAMLEHFEKSKSVAGYDGPVYSDRLPFDFDATDLAQSLQSAKSFLLHLEHQYEIDLRILKVYFSGSKGFHIELPSELLGFEPSLFLNKIFKEIAKKLLPEGLLVDG